MIGTSVASDDRTITVRVPITIKRRGGRKLVLAPHGTEGHRRACHPPRRQRHGEGDRACIPVAAID